MHTEHEAAESVTVHIDGKAVAANTAMSVAAATVQAGSMCSRRSVSGEVRFALCGMGVCQECRVSIDGVPHRLACQVRCRDGMAVVTAASAAE
jgi:aerobic-type carbon monoxide dehydrogenase small subunit (CoxS/CutS family)